MLDWRAVSFEEVSVSSFKTGLVEFFEIFSVFALALDFDLRFDLLLEELLFSNNEKENFSESKEPIWRMKFGIQTVTIT